MLTLNKNGKPEGKPIFENSIGKTKDAETESLSYMGTILSSLGNEDALSIFFEAKDGIMSSTETIKKLGLTQKRYYTRLNQLLESDLIYKGDVSYQQTMLGKICFKMVEVFEKALHHRDRLDLLTKLNNSNTLSLTEKRDVAKALLIDDIPGFLDTSSLVNPMRMIDNYETLVEETIDLVEKAENNVYFATRYFDTRVVEANLRGVKRGVKFSYLYGMTDSNLEKTLTTLRMMFSAPKMLKSFYSWLNAPDLQMRLVDLPYNFIVVDDKYGILEVQKPFINVFSLAFTFESSVICQRLIGTFNSLWNKGSKADSMIESFVTPIAANEMKEK
jgi:hypothetical protein